MITSTQDSRYPSCRPTNPGTCAQCTLSYDCRAKAKESRPVSWPLVAFVLVGIATVLSYAF